MEYWLNVVAAFAVSLIAFFIVGYIKRRGPKSPQLTDYFALSGVPPPKPLLDFNIDEAKPRPYRPLRWVYHQTMSLMPMDPDYWLELESTYHERLAQRNAIYKENGKAVVDATPGSEQACQELLEMSLQYLCVRYPNSFSFDAATGTFHNRILNTATPNILSRTGIKALEALLENVPEDFAMMMEDKEKPGTYRFRAGITLSAIGWNISQKIGKTLPEIHGPVPFYKEKLQTSVDRYFTKIACDKPIQRGSWGVEVGQPLYLQTSDPHWDLRETQDPNISISDIYLRVDWQTLRRLPRSQAVVFNYKALFTPALQLRKEPYVPRLLLTVLTEADGKFLEYKSSWHTSHKVVPALKEWAEEQEEQGLVPKEWKVRTLDEHPFFPGWDKES